MMAACHYNHYMEAGLLPHVNALAQPAFNMIEIIGSHAMLSFKKLNVGAPG
jgi:hypothetical protein